MAGIIKLILRLIVIIVLIISWVIVRLMLLMVQIRVLIALEVLVSLSPSILLAWIVLDVALILAHICTRIIVVLRWRRLLELVLVRLGVGIHLLVLIRRRIVVALTTRGRMPSWRRHLWRWVSTRRHLIPAWRRHVLLLLLLRRWIVLGDFHGVVGRLVS